MAAAVESKQALYEELRPLLVDPRDAADGRVWSMCPCHPDGQKHGKRSLSLSPRYGLQCFAGCEFTAILSALRQRPSLNGHQDPNQGRLVAVYEYRDSAGVLIAEKARIEYSDGRKAFRWRLPGGSSKDGLQGKPLSEMPLYGAELLPKAEPKEPVFFVEGEKAQRSLMVQGFLAVTHGGGSGTKDFGASLDILKGRKVVLWPDNDGVGRTYMQTVMARLSGMAREVSYFECPLALPEKGDAYDYFDRGGTPEQIHQALASAAPITEPKVEFLGDDALAVTMPSPAGTIKFEFAAIETAARRFDAEMTLQLGKHDSDPYCDRVNLFSSTQRTELRRELDGLYGKDYGWARILNRVFWMARQSYLSVDRAVDVSDIQPQETERFLVPDILPLGAPTIFFGDGSASKSTIASTLTFEVATGGRFLGRQVPCVPVLYVDWEDTESVFQRRIRRLGGMDEIVIAKGLLHYWSAKGIPLQEQVTAIQRKVQQAGIGLVVMDSISAGCAGPVEDSVVASGYINAVKKLGVTALLIAHITKAGQEDKPFGSAMWHNAARRTWLVKRESDEDTGELKVAMVCKKVNDGRKPRSIAIEVSFSDPSGPIAVKQASFEVGTDLAKSAMSLNARIQAALARGPMRRRDLATTLEEKEDVVRTVMSRHKAAYQQDGEMWMLATPREVGL